MSFVVVELPLRKASRPTAHELVDGTVARQEDVVFENAVAGQERPVGEDATVADSAIMRDVGIDHEEIMAADPRGPCMGRAAMNRHVFPKDIVVADLQVGRLAVVLEMLWLLAQHGAGEDVVALSHDKRTDQMNMRPKHAARTDAHRPLDDHVRPDHNVVGKVCFGCNHRGGMNAR